MLQRWWEAAKRLGATVEVPPTKLPQGGEVAVSHDPLGMPFGLWKRS
jgi:predicted enzyme related to lactoylglutathione lyase